MGVRRLTVEYDDGEGWGYVNDGGRGYVTLDGVFKLIAKGQSPGPQAEQTQPDPPNQETSRSTESSESPPQT